MKKILTLFIRLISGIMGRRNFEKLLIYCAKTINVNLYVHGLIQIGALSSFVQDVNGEELFIKKTLARLLKNEAAPVFFDVGANIGDFSLELRKYFPNANISAFEPVKTTYDILANNTTDHHIKLHNIGFSSTTGTGQLFNTVNEINNTIASAYKDVFTEVFNNQTELGAIAFEMDTLDNFCPANNITAIDFLKIDVEGHEYSVLSGAENMLLNKRIKVIQFEVNSHNVYSRVFLRDFYLLLKDFEFYRIVKDGLIPLGAYRQVNEIFTMQNIVAVQKEICGLIDEKSLVILK